MQALALAYEWAQKQLTTPVPRIDSRVVLLSGREEPWPEALGYLTAPDDAPLCGVQFRVEPVYQYTLDQLLARDSVLWLIFAPLARDATPEAMREVIDVLKKRVRSRRQFAELASAMAVVADADARGRGLREPITAHLPEELVMQSWIYQQGLKKGEERGEARGELRTLRRALEAAINTRGFRLTAKRREQIEQETRADVLMVWFQAALTADRVTDVFGTR